MTQKYNNDLVDFIKATLPPDKSIVLVGMMGAGKTTVGRKLAFKLDLPFTDSDAEIEQAAQMSISEIFERYSEPHFREIEKKIIMRLLKEKRGILSTGGGSFIDDTLRAAIRQYGISVWLKVDLDVLLARVQRKDHRPLLQGENPEQVMRDLVNNRYPVYALSDIIVENYHSSQEKATETLIKELARFLNCPFL